MDRAGEVRSHKVKEEQPEVEAFASTSLLERT